MNWPDTTRRILSGCGSRFGRGGWRPAEGGQLRGWLALVCVLLVLMAGSTQLLHQHAVGEAQNPNCSLCVVAHLSATVTPVTVALVQLEQVNFIPLVVPRTAPARPIPFHLYVRPPPLMHA